jgi:hypothetical protein
MGVALVLGLLGASLNARLSAALVPFVLYCLVVGQTRLWLSTHASAPDPRATAFLDAPDKEEPIVVASALQYSPMWFYARPELRVRLHYLADPQYAQTHVGDFVPEFSLLLEHEVIPMPVDQYSSFVAQHRQFLMYTSGLGRLEWLPDRLKGDGWSIQPVARSGQAQLFRVTAPVP